jgi:RHS repeat-associated protein
MWILTVKDLRRIAYAGSDVDGASVDFAGKYTQSQQTIKDRYTAFGVEYKGSDNDDYVNGGGFCCDDAPGLRAGAIGNGNDNPEIYQYYYHSDHLGSTSLITNLDGEVVQHVEYVPFGEVFIEERNNRWNTPYLFNAKELDEETGLYYYGARYYDSRISLWLSTDPLQEKYPNVSTYAYCLNNPVNYIDPTGMSTHTDSLGHVLSVYNDDNFGVYKHGINADSYDGSMLKAKNGEKMGETSYWDEFLPIYSDEERGFTIQYGKSFDPIIKQMHELAKDMDLIDIANASKPNGLFDIKENYKNEGAFFNGKYVSSRSAGNYLAGYNASTGKLEFLQLYVYGDKKNALGVGISFTSFQKIAGGLHVNGNLSASEMAKIIVLGKSYAPAPTYGESIYQYRMSLSGWNYGKRKK